MASTKTVSRTRGSKAAGTPARSTTRQPAGAETGGRPRAAAKTSGAKGGGAGSPVRKTAAKAAPATGTTKGAARPATGSASKPGASRSRSLTPKSASPAATRATRARAKPKVVDPIAALRTQVLEGLERIKARDIQEIDVRGRASFADLLVVASGTSTTHVKAIADEVIKHAKRIGTMPLGVEGAREAEWVLVDLGDIVVHVMLPRVREFYALERLWTVGAEEPVAARPA